MAKKRGVGGEDAAAWVSVGVSSLGYGYSQPLTMSPFF